MRTAFDDYLVNSGEPCWPRRITRAWLVILLLVARSGVQGDKCCLYSMTVECVMNRSDFVVRVSE
jgi:hypothetical protein